MNRALLAGTAIAAALATTAVGYRMGAGTWPSVTSAGPEASPRNAASTPARTVLYWKHPDGMPDYSPTATKTPDGRDFIPVYENEEKELAGTKPPPQQAARADRKILYYRNPMGLADTSPTPKKDWMGMDYIAVYEGEEDSGSTIKVSLDKVQRSGVRTIAVERRRLETVIRAPGVAKPNERTFHTATLRTDGFIEKLYVNETGRHVAAGEPMFRIYSPQMVAVQVDYRTANAPPNSPDESGALQRLRNLGMPETVLDELRRTRKPILTFDWPAPVSGVVTMKNVIEGQMVKAGDEMFRFVDLSTVWVVADVPEQDVGRLKEGQKAKIRFRAFPGEVFEGKVTFVLHELEMATRTAKARIEVENPDHRIRHDMFAEVEIDAGTDDPDRLVIPNSALIDSGNRQVVIVDKGDGRFEPRDVTVGERGNGFLVIEHGLQAGDQVVVSANFLLDAESNLKAALSSFTADTPTGSTAAHTGHQP
jgi:Cu(I)/Ag(I) efflux system membrane fusion protein